MKVLIRSHCHICEQDINYIKEILRRQAPVELWAYGLKSSKVMGTTAFEIVICQDRCWYEVFQRLTTINDEEYAQMHVIKHSEKSASEFPFSPYERIYQSFTKEKEVEWTQIATINPPFALCLYQDTFCTCNEKQDGTKILRYKYADIALGFESLSSGLLLQIMDHPYYLKICRKEEELDDIRKLWEFHVTEEDEVEQMRVQGSEEYFHCQRLVDFSRTKTTLSDCI